MLKSIKRCNQLLSNVTQFWRSWIALVLMSQMEDEYIGDCQSQKFQKDTFSLLRKQWEKQISRGYFHFVWESRLSDKGKDLPDVLLSLGPFHLPYTSGFSPTLLISFLLKYAEE